MYFLIYPLLHLHGATTEFVAIIMLCTYNVAIEATLSTTVLQLIVQHLVTHVLMGTMPFVH